MTRHLGTVVVYSTYFTLEPGDDGDTQPVYRDEPWTDVHENVSASEAAQILMREGLSFTASGAYWAADPDGSYTSNYSTGEECERTAVLEGFPARLHNAIVRKVG